MTKFFLYARKSTDEPERQVLSIDAQVTELKELAEREHLDIVDTFIESKTAKEPGRAIFNEMLSRIEKGEAAGILSWHPDRLARNSVDGGKVIYLIDTGKITALKFCTFWFEATPQGKFMLNIAFGQSKYYIDNLSENVKRGQRQKVRRGEYPGVAPTGYVNNLADHKIYPDPERFRLVKKMYEMYATGNYTLKDMRVMGLRSKNDKTLSISNVHKLLTNPIYYGAFVYSGELHQGIHKPAISKRLFDTVQLMLAEKSRPKKRSEKLFPFRGLLKGAECEGAITSEHKTKKSGRQYVYYRCTKKKGVCTQAYIREELLASQIAKFIQSVSLSPALADLALQELDKDKEENSLLSETHKQTIKAEIVACKNMLDKLLDAHLEDTISTEEYKEKKNTLLNQKIELEEKLTKLEREGSRSLELTKNLVFHAKQAHIVANARNHSDLSDFFKRIGSNPLLNRREIQSTPRGAWRILAEFNSESESTGGIFANSGFLTRLRRVEESNL